MVELTIEQKAKAYDDVKEKIALRFGSNVAEEIFSEYEMNEDERIKKAILSGLNYLETELGWDAVGKVDILDMVAWIEKQGVQNVPPVDEHAWLSLVSDVLTWKDGIGQYLDDPRVQKLAKALASEYAQKLYTNQEPVDKNEPKFHEGDWIITNNKKYIYQVVKVKRGIYVVRDNADNREYHVSIESADRDGRLWTIQDANDGDVLAGKIDGDSYILIFKQVKDGWVETYGHYYDSVDRFCVPSQLFCRDYQGTFIPANKDQRDSLIIAMTDSGYMFDFEKKELKKLG